MKRFLVPGQCADCGAPTGTDPRCGSCGLVQTGQVADDLRATLLHADRILDVLREVSVRAPAPAMTPEPAPAVPAPRAGATRSRRGLPAVSVPVVLLGLGTVCVLVAAFVFVAVTWTDLSLAWRTSILLAVTALGTAAAVWAVRTGLRGAAEALTLMAAGLLLMDLLAGNSAGLPVLSWLHGNAFGWLVSLTMLATGLGWSLWARRTVTRVLLGQQVVAALAVLAVVELTVDGWSYDFEWLGAVVAVVAGLSALALWRLRLPLVAVTAGGASLLGWLLLATAGVLRAVATSSAGELFVQLEAAPLLVASALAALTAVPSRVPGPLRTVAAVGAVAGPTLAVLLPVRQLAFTPAVLVVTVAALVLATGAVAVPGSWRDAGRAVGLGTAMFPGSVFVSAAALGVGRLVETADPFWGSAITDPLAQRFVAGPGQVWLYLPLGGLLAAMLTTVGLGRVRVRLILPWAAVGVAVGALTSLFASGWPLWAVGSVLAVGCAVAVSAFVWSGRSVWLAAAGTPMLLGVVAAAPSVRATAVFVAGYGLMLLVVAARVRPVVARAGLTTGAVMLLAVALEAGADLADLSVAGRGIAVLVFASAVAVLAQWYARRTGGPGRRLGLECAAVLLAPVGVGQTADSGSLALSIGLSLLGVTGVLVSLVSADRRRVAWAGSALLVLASWVRLDALDVGAIEAYTLPGATALLVAGLLPMRRTPATSWQALSAPLGLGVGPSLLVALGEPTSLRALLVGVVGLVLVGAAVRLRWGAPLLVGGTAVALLALVNVGPYAAGLPRWVVFGTAGVALLALGVTWEQRRRDLALAHRYAARLR